MLCVARRTTNGVTFNCSREWPSTYLKSQALVLVNTYTISDALIIFGIPDYIRTMFDCAIMNKSGQESILIFAVNEVLAQVILPT